MMNDLNRVEPRPKFNTRIIGSALCISYSLAVFSIIWLMFTHDSFSVPTLPTLAAFFIGFISCLTSQILLVFYLAYVSVHIQKTLEARLIFIDTVLMVLLTYMLFISFPVVQMRLNRLSLNTTSPAQS